MKFVNIETGKEVTNKAEAYEAIKALVSKADDLVFNQATTIADHYGIEFIGHDDEATSTYYPKGTPEDNVGYSSWQEPEFDEAGKLEYGVWISSSEQC